MFRPSTIQSLVLLLLLSLVARQTLLALVCALLLLTAGVAALWSRWSLRRVSYVRELGQSRAFIGDEVELRIRIANRKPLPLAALEVYDRIPQGLVISGDDVIGDRDGRNVLHRTTALRWYEAVTWRYTLRCTRRGSYRVGPVQLQAGDPFGFYGTRREHEERTNLIVYPRPLPLEQLGLPHRQPLGQLRAHALIRDPLSTVGVREYQPDDSIRDIHWTATARTGTLQTRIYEPTTALDLAIFLDLDSFEQYYQGIDEEQVERLISAAATLAQTGLAEGYAVGLYVNGSPAQFEQLVRLPPGRSPAQLEHIMETLARLTPYSVTSMATLLRTTAIALPLGTTLLLVSAIAPQATRVQLARLQERGRTVGWLHLGEDAPRLPGVVVWHAPPVNDWRKSGG